MRKTDRNIGNNNRWIGRHKYGPTLSEMRDKTKPQPPTSPRNFKAIPFREKRFIGLICDAEAELEKRKGENRIFNFGHLYFVGTIEQYKQL